MPSLNGHEDWHTHCQKVHKSATKIRQRENPSFESCGRLGLEEVNGVHKKAVCILARLGM